MRIFFYISKMHHFIPLKVYNKYLEAKPGTDSVKKRVAELSDKKNEKAKVANEVAVVKDVYRSNSHSTRLKKKQHLNLMDNYYSSGIGYGIGFGGDKCPYKGAVSFNATDGFVIAKGKAVVDLAFNSAFLVSANKTWFYNAYQAPPGANLDVSGIGYSESVTLGLFPVAVNNKNLSLAVGPMAGVNFYIISGNYSYGSIDSKITLCYGVKTNLYLGENVMFFMQLMLNAANTATLSDTYSGYSVPTNYNMLNIGIAYKFDTWW